MNEVLSVIGSVIASILTVAIPLATWVNKRFKDCDQARDELLARIVKMEAANGCDFPQWIRDAKGHFISLNIEFMRLVATPLGYTKSDLIGKTFEELDHFSKSLREILIHLDKQALEHGFACANHVEIYPGRFVSIHKTTGESAQGDIVYVGELVPE